MEEELRSPEYTDVLIRIKEDIRSARIRAFSAVNRELMGLYWQVGQVILAKSAWGSGFVEQLSKDIRSEFPDLKGFSVRNLWYMRKFAEDFPDAEIVQTLSAEISWSHTTMLLDKVKGFDERVWYAKMAGEHGWSVLVLDHQIATNLYGRQVSAQKLQNFERALPKKQSDLAISAMKDPYVFDFLSFGTEAAELEIEGELVRNVMKLLLELGSGFAFVGRQYHLVVGNDDFYIDLLFYHLKLRCYVVVDLKMGKFTPEQAGKMNFYLSAVDDLVKAPEDNPSIGLILCRDENSLVAEYALRDMNKPIGVSEYKFMQELPRELRDALPNAEIFGDRVLKEMETEYKHMGRDNEEKRRGV